MLMDSWHSHIAPHRIGLGEHFSALFFDDHELDIKIIVMNTLD